MSARSILVSLCFFVALLAAVPTLGAQPTKPAAPKDGPLGMKFVPLPKGTFYMGWDGEKKGTKTEIKDDFEIAVHTVTQGQWQALMGNNPSYFSRDGDGKNKVKDIAVTPAKTEGETVSLRYVVPPNEPTELWDSGVAVSARAGDTLKTLASEFHVPLWSLTQANSMSDSAPLTDGQRVVVPRHLAPAPVTAVAQPVSSSSPPASPAR